MDKLSNRRMSQDAAQFNTMKQFEKTLSKLPRYSQPDIIEQQVFTELEAIRRKDERFRSEHKARRGQLTGSSWNSLHLDGFMRNKGSNPVTQRSYELNQQPIAMDSRPQHYFRTTKLNQNASQMGYSNINPMASHPRVEPHGLDRFLSEVLYRKNMGSPETELTKPGTHSNYSVRDRITNPLTFKDVPIAPQRHLEAKRVRLLNLIEKQYPRGILGIDNPDHALRFYKQPTTERSNVRIQPTCNASYQLDREWKSKKRVPSPKPEFVHRTRECIRRLSNNSGCTYNILSNCQK